DRDQIGAQGSRHDGIGDHAVPSYEGFPVWSSVHFQAVRDPDASALDLNPKVRRIIDISNRVVGSYDSVTVVGDIDVGSGFFKSQVGDVSPALEPTDRIT